MTSRSRRTVSSRRRGASAIRVYDALGAEACSAGGDVQVPR